MKYRTKDCENCEYADTDLDFEGNEIFYCIYSVIECNPKLKGV